MERSTSDLLAKQSLTFATMLRVCVGLFPPTMVTFGVNAATSQDARQMPHFSPPLREVGITNGKEFRNTRVAKYPSCEIMEHCASISYPNQHEPREIQNRCDRVPLADLRQCHGRTGVRSFGRRRGARATRQILRSRRNLACCHRTQSA